MNLLNQVNPGTPVGNLSSPSFGESLSSGGGFGRDAGSSAGNRSIELQGALLLLSHAAIGVIRAPAVSLE